MRTLDATYGMRGGKRGLALMAVIMMMVLVGAAIVAMGVLFTGEVKRTRSALAGAQLRQMLLAAEPAAREELARGIAERDVTVSMPVNGGTMSMHVSGSGEKAVVRAQARIGQMAAVSVMTYGRTDKGWVVEGAVLWGAQ